MSLQQVQNSASEFQCIDKSREGSITNSNRTRKGDRKEKDIENKLEKKFSVRIICTNQGLELDGVHNLMTPPSSPEANVEVALQ